MTTLDLSAKEETTDQSFGESQKKNPIRMIAEGFLIAFLALLGLVLGAFAAVLIGFYTGWISIGC